MKKAQLDEKLEEALFDEKQIIDKRQASEYILLYIKLLEILEEYFPYKISHIHIKFIVNLLSKEKSQVSILTFLDQSSQEEDQWAPENI